MSVKIRLRRMGKKKQPHYRIVVADTQSPRDGRFVESLGYYNPLTSPARLVVDLDRVDYWINEGATPSNTVANLVTKARSGGDDTVSLGALDPEESRAAKRAEAEAKRKAEETAAAAAVAGEAAGAEAAAAEEAPAADVAAESPAAEAESSAEAGEGAAGEEE